VTRFGTDILVQAEALAKFTEDAPRLTRTYLTPEHRAAGDFLRSLMRDAGMPADYDALGNVVGRYAAATPDAPVVICGSHMDSVRNAGKYDGLFGILTAIACVRDLFRRGKRLPFHFDVVAFGDEEGVRFGSTLMGSRAMAGAFDPAWLERKDNDGVTLRQALLDFGGDPEGWPALDRRGRNVAAYIESHIEQGPVLLDAGLPVGVVTSIAGASRARVTVTGLAGHAGTVPRAVRRDALTAAAEMILAIEAHCRANPLLVGTVGRIEALPGAVNVIPQDVTFSLDLRSGEDGPRRTAFAAIHAGLETIAARRSVALGWDAYFDSAAAPCDARLQEQLADAIVRAGFRVKRLPSGAGHDAMMFPPVCPTAMLFVRCGNGGISHHPDETLSAEDADLATRVLLDFLEHFSPS
jgi:hydantoinase/carbamoylase family amidase